MTIKPEDVFNGSATPEGLTGDQRELGRALTAHMLPDTFVLDESAERVLRRFHAGLTDDVAALSMYSGMNADISGPGTTSRPRHLDVAKFVHRACVHRVQAVFGVPVGQAGVGVTPKMSPAVTAYLAQAAEEHRGR